MFVPYIMIIQLATMMGASAQSASYLIAVTGLCNVFGRILVGLIADRTWANALCINNLALIIAGVATMLCPFCQTFGHLVTYCCVFGLSVGEYSNGGISPAVPPSEFWKCCSRTPL